MPINHLAPRSTRFDNGPDPQQSEDTHAPVGEQLKRWLLGGDNIRTSPALFDLADYKGEIITDLFGEDSYFADSNLFWQAQEEAIKARKLALMESGRTSVEAFERGQYFSEWEYEKTAKKDGGRVFDTIRHNGEVPASSRQLAFIWNSKLKADGRPTISSSIS